MRIDGPPIDDGWDDATPEQSELSSALIFNRGDHVELAERLVSELLDASQTVHTLGQFYQYRTEEGIFAVTDHSSLSTRVQSYSGARVTCDSKPLRLRAADVHGAIRLAADRLSDPDFFTDAPAGIAFANGFVSVTASGVSLAPHSESFRARYVYPFAFRPDSQPAGFLAFLGQVFRDDSDRSEKIQLLREFFGVALLGRATTFQRALVLHGPGANGKSVAGQVLENCAPPGSVCSIPPQDLAQEYRRAMLAGKLLNIVSELPEADILDAESWKATVSGDLMTGREIRGAPFAFRPVAGHIYSANRLPGTTDQTHGFWRRLLVISFDRVFAAHEQNPRLAEQLTLERPEIVAWALRGAHEAMASDRYTLPPSAKAAGEAWQIASDQVRAFVEERCSRLSLDAPQATWVTAEQLYRAFKGWAQENGHRVMASNKFGERMKLLGMPPLRTKHARLYAVKIEGGDAW